MIDDTVVKIIIAVAGAVLGSGGLWAWLQRRTPDADQQQLSRDVFYKTLDERERAAQQRIQDVLQEQQKREEHWLKEVQQRDKLLDECERGHAQAAAELKAAQDRADWLQQRLASAIMWEEHWRKIAQGEK